MCVREGVPVLAGSAAYALGEAFGWHVGLARVLARARGFYATIALAMIAGVGLNLSVIDPVKALFWSAVINGVVSVPIMVMMMLLAMRSSVMGRFTLHPALCSAGWAATLVMAVAAIAMIVTMV